MCRDEGTSPQPELDLDITGLQERAVSEYGDITLQQSGPGHATAHSEVASVVILNLDI